jgi:hypothetical protein
MLPPLKVLVRTLSVLPLLLLVWAYAQPLLITATPHDTLDLIVVDGADERTLLRDDAVDLFDPSPSPDGDLIAVAATEALADPAASREGTDWSFLVIDRSGAERWRWALPGSDGRFRPAGGFDLVWLPDGRSLLAQGFRDDFVWEVRRYFLDAERAVALGTGFGILLAPDGERFAITRDEGIYLVRIADGRERLLGSGYALGWSADGEALVIERNSALFVVPIDDPDATDFIGDSGPYIGMVSAPDGGRYVVTIPLDGDSAIFFYDREHRFLGSYELPGLAADLAWLDGGRVAVELAHDAGWSIVAIDPKGRVSSLVPESGGAGVSVLRE